MRLGTRLETESICCGPPTFTRQQSIDYVDKNQWVKAEAKMAVKKALEEGGLETAQGKPWVSIVGCFDDGTHHFALPLMSQDIDDVSTRHQGRDRIGETDYIEAVVTRFSEVLAGLGAGKHKLAIQLAPRGIVSIGSGCIKGACGARICSRMRSAAGDPHIESLWGLLWRAVLLSEEEGVSYVR